MINSAADDGLDAAMERLSAEDCYRLLATSSSGGWEAKAEHYPMIFPVNYAMDGTTIVIRTQPGTKLSAAAHANVTFKVDQIHQGTRGGWSVLVRELAEEVTSEHRADLVERTKRSGVQPWAPGEYGHWWRLITHHVTGRRIILGQLPPAVDPRAYL